MSYTIPSDSHSVGDSGHTTHHNNIADVLAKGMPVNVLNTAFAGGADPTGGADSWTAIQTALLSFGSLTSWAQGVGGEVFIPAGLFMTSKPLIVPSGVTVRMSGPYSTVVRVITGSNCPVFQAAQYNSSAQATLLSGLVPGLTAGAILNAFYWGIENGGIHGDAFGTTVPGYQHGIDTELNPATSAAPGDPDFDPAPKFRDLIITGCTGDGIYYNGRSGALVERVLSQYHNGLAIAPSFDTTLVDVLGNNCGGGFYFNHSSVVSAGCKSYNHIDRTWVSGTAYSPGNVAVSAGVMYFCTAAVSGSTAPASDPAHWTALSATAPQATGIGAYWDTGCGEHSHAGIDCQENSRWDYYFKGPNTGGISVDGTSANVNFNNGQPSYNSANPNHYSCAAFDGVSGVNVRLSSSQQASGSAVIASSLNSPGANTLIATTDGTEAALFSGGAPAFALVNGVFQSPVTGVQSVTSGVVALAYSATLSISAAAGNHFRVTLAGNATVAAPTGPADGQKITLEVIQDATGSRTLTWNAVFDFGTAGTPSLTATAAKRDLVGFIYSASASKWLFAGIQGGL